ncbi:hypothetical protein BBJ28_00019220 [Nothophytophthora sp. Chile5]|nr:hypothetical protein BBJ28_00019220 [Nothophytophthora sp. Chile5]
MSIQKTSSIAPLPTQRKTVKCAAGGAVVAGKGVARVLLPDKKPRKSRRVYDLTPEYMAQYFHLSQREASIHMGVAVITVKRNCKRYGINWPYRANKNKKRFPLSNKGLAFSRLPIDCMTDSDTESDVESDECTEIEQITEDCGRILISMHRTPLWHSAL